MLRMDKTSSANNPAVGNLGAMGARERLERKEIYMAVPLVLAQRIVRVLDDAHVTHEERVAAAEIAARLERLYLINEMPIVEERLAG